MYRMMTKAGAGNDRIRNVMQMSSVIPLSHCAAKYAVAVSDPWHPTALGACVPSGNPRPSFKVNTIKRFNMVIGTNGVGWVVLMPTITNNTHIAYATQVGYASGGVGDPDNLYLFTATGAPLGGVLPITNTTAPFSDTQLAGVNIEEGAPPIANGRIVSCGLSVTYAGTVMNMGGTITILSRASHQSVLSQNTGVGSADGLAIKISGVQAYRESRVSTVKPTKYTIVDSARLDLEDDYSLNSRTQQTTSSSEDSAGSLYPFSQGQLTLPAISTTLGNMGPPANLILVTGAVPGSSFVCELVMHLEYNGPGAQYALTPVHVDPVGFGMVREASASLPLLQAGAPEASPSGLMLSSLKEAASHLGPAALRAGGAMLSTALSGGSRASIAAAGAYGMLGV